MLVAALVAGLSSTQNRAASAEIILGMSAAFTGASGQLGIELYRGAQAYFAEVNATGGVAGRRIRLMTLDDGYTPTRAIHNTIALVEGEQVPLLFGYVGTPTVTRVLPLLKRYETRGPYLLFPSLAPSRTGSSHTRTSSSTCGRRICRKPPASSIISSASGVAGSPSSIRPMPTAAADGTVFGRRWRATT